jgi:hypothetical protein
MAGLASRAFWIRSVAMWRQDGKWMRRWDGEAGQGTAPVSVAEGTAEPRRGVEAQGLSENLA